MGNNRLGNKSKVIAVLLLVLLVVAWFVVSKPFERQDSDPVQVATEVEVDAGADAETGVDVANVDVGDSEETEVTFVANDTDDNEANVEAEPEETVAANETLIGAETEENTDSQPEAAPVVETYRFRNKKLLNQHYEKHGIEMGFDSAASYEAAASAVITNPNALSKTEAEDGDYVYYVEATNEFVVLSKDGYIRTYFNPSAGIKYYNRQ